MNSGQGGLELFIKKLQQKPHSQFRSPHDNFRGFSNCDSETHFKFRVSDGLSSWFTFSVKLNIFGTR